MAASAVLAVGAAAQASASELPAGSAVRNGLQDEVPWTNPNPEVPWTGPIQDLVGEIGDITGIVLDGVEVPWT